MGNDTTGAFLKERNDADLSPAQARRNQANPIPIEDPGKEGLKFSPGKIAKDIGRGILETPKQVVGGVFDAFKEAGDAASSIVEFFGLPSTLQVMNEKGEFDLELLTQKEVEAKGLKTPVELATPGEAVTTTGGLVRGISQFLTGFIPAAKALKTGKAATTGARIAKTALAGAIADATVFDPHEERLSDLVQEFPALDNPVTEFLASNPEDSEALGRFKNTIEGLGLGVITDGFVQSVRGIRANRIRKLEATAAKKEAGQIEKLAAIEPEEVARAEKEFIQFDKKEVDKPLFKVGKKEAGKERALNINLDKLDTEQDVKDLIEGVGDAFNKDINQSRRQVITMLENERLADDLGMTVPELLSRRRGEAFNAEQALAARKILVASGENLVSLAKKAEAGSEKEVIQFRKALSQHHAIQSQVSGLTAEAGRALGSFRIQAKTAKEQQRLIKDALESGGGTENSRSLAKQVAQLEESHQLNKFVKQASGATTKEMVYEAWINGLLSSPATHVVNTLSNSIVAGWQVGERKIASLIGRTLDFQSIPEGEATAQLFGMAQGAKDGMRLAWHALKTGEPSDAITKLETSGFRSITSENLNLSGTPGRFADFIGSTVRGPSRFLTAEDELFKTIGYRMELHSQAFRQAKLEGLEGEAMARKIAEIVDNPPENISLAAVDASRYQTFTRPLGESGQAFQTAVQKSDIKTRFGDIPAGRIIVPFIRTPTNIIKYVGERTVLAPLAKGFKGEMAAGGARRDLALAKIATGSMLMAAAADMTLTGQVTGAGPVNPQMKNILRTTGWQPYSIKVGDTWHSYSRLDPIGATIGLAADVSEIIGQLDEADALDIGTSAVVAVAQNVTSKTYMSGISEFFEVMASVSPDPDRSFLRIRRWIERLAGSVVPAGVAQIERTVSPELSATEGIIEKIKSRIPGYSDDLPPRRNIFGEPIVLSGGIGPDIMSPLYSSTDKKDPVAEEIVAQQTLLRMPMKNIQGVRLNSKQYDQYIKFYSGENNKFVKIPLKKQLQEVFRSPVYKNATEGQEGGKSMIIRTVFDGYREAAKQMMILKMPELEKEIRQKKITKAMKLGG